VTFEQLCPDPARGYERLPAQHRSRLVAGCFLCFARLIVGRSLPKQGSHGLARRGALSSAANLAGTSSCGSGRAVRARSRVASSIAINASLAQDSGVHVARERGFDCHAINEFPVARGAS